MRGHTELDLVFQFVIEQQHIEHDQLHDDTMPELVHLRLDDGCVGASLRQLWHGLFLLGSIYTWDRRRSSSRELPRLCPANHDQHDDHADMRELWM